MADEAQTPGGADAAASAPADPAAAAAAPAVVIDRVERARVRRAPKFSVFLVLGSALGLFVAMILTTAFGGTDAPSPNTGFVYSPVQVFGFLALISVPAGLVLGAVVALVFDRASRRHTREVTVDRTSVHPAP